MKLQFLLSTPISRNWITLIHKDFIQYLEYKFYYNYNELIDDMPIQLNSKEHKDKLIFIDVSDSLYIEYISNLKLIYPEIRLVAFGLKLESNEIFKLFKKGFCSYIAIGSSPIDLFYLVNMLKFKKVYLNTHIVDSILENIMENSLYDIREYDQYKSYEYNNKLNRFSLTKKEKIVIEYLLQGLTYMDMSRLIGVTTFAINQRIKSIYKKLGINSRSELSYFLLKNN
jgi:DNA-binding NarL/FixJ family response regulator